MFFSWPSLNSKPGSVSTYLNGNGFFFYSYMKLEEITQKKYLYTYGQIHVYINPLVIAFDI